MSRPSLWTNIDCINLDKTRTYLERSKFSPINLSLDGNYIGYFDPPLELIADATGRLKSLEIDVGPQDLRRISICLSRPTPPLEVLSIRSYGDPTLSSSLFNGDLSSLRKLRLVHVHTELPWRNMVNLTSLALTHASPPLSLAQLLDFFESAPHLREVDIPYSTPISGTQSKRLVPLASLQRMDASGRPSQLLFEHLLIPVGAHLIMGTDRLPRPTIEGRRPRFIDNLRNLPNFTTIKFSLEPECLQFSGPNGTVAMVSKSFRDSQRLESLGHFDTSKTERLELESYFDMSGDPLYQTLLLMNDLRTFKLNLGASSEILLDALDPSTSSSGAVACPRLEDLVIETDWQIDLKPIMRVAAARASGGAKLKLVTFVKPPEIVFSRADTLEIVKHLLPVFYCEDNGAGGSDDSGEEI